MPNPWDAGSARVLERLGFKALATTSAGFAWTTGRADNHVTLDDAIGHLRTIVDAVAVPVNAAFEGGYAVEPDQVAANVRLAAATGIAGLRSRIPRVTAAAAPRFRPGRGSYPGGAPCHR
jgi:2-methylisocitrate lyase-like PEP mutase family enzyme